MLLDPMNHQETVHMIAERLLFDSLPRENMKRVKATLLNNPRSLDRFVRLLRREGVDASHVRFCWHLTGSAAAADAIQAGGIRCDGDQCLRGRYGPGGYVATCAAKANGYACSEGVGGERHLFLVLALPGDRVVRGTRGVRPPCTAADLPSHPTEFCFVDSARLHCACRFDYVWAPTGRRPKVKTAGDHARAWRHSLPCTERRVCPSR